MASETVRLFDARSTYVKLISFTVAGRTILHPILRALERIAFDEDPLRILLIETSYQPFISLFHMMGVLKERPDLAAIREYSVRCLQAYIPILFGCTANYASALAFELLRGPAPEFRDFVRIKFKNGTDSNFQTIRVFEHEEDSLPVTEFIYRLEVRVQRGVTPHSSTFLFPLLALRHSRHEAMELGMREQPLVPIQHCLHHGCRTEVDDGRSFCTALVYVFDVCVHDVRQASDCQAWEAIHGDKAARGKGAPNNEKRLFLTRFHHRTMRRSSMRKLGYFLEHLHHRIAL